MRIPIGDAKRIAKDRDQRQVIIIAWDGKMTHVTTYGVSAADCVQAADGGNRLKKSMGWPESLCDAKPARLIALESQLARAKAEADSLLSDLHTCQRRCAELQSQVNNP